MVTSIWVDFSLIEKIYYGIAVISSFILILQLVIAFISGIDMHPGTDLDIGVPHFQLLTIRNFVAFFVLFGWSGLAFIQLDFPLLATLGLSFLCGFIMMCVTAGLFLLSIKLQSDGTLDYSQAKGLTGTVYLSIPPYRQGKGKITVTLQNRMIEMDALNISNLEILTGTPVRITDVINSNAVVERLGG